MKTTKKLMLMLLVVAGMATFTSCKKEKQENPEQENLAPNGITVYPPASEYHYDGDGINHPFVDLGLPSGTLWATQNVGADSTNAFGWFIAWGETEPKSVYDWSTYKYCEGSQLKLTKYSHDASPDFLKFGYNGYNDTLSVLLPCDDAATVNWGSNWRTPTYDEWVELAENCTAAYINQDSVCGILYTGPNGNTLFLPGTGKYFDSNYTGWGYGDYWSSSLPTLWVDHAWRFGFIIHGTDYFMYEESRQFGIPVRPVRASR